MTLREAFDLVHEIRKVAKPNTGFFRQLSEYEKQICGVTSIKFQRIQDEEHGHLFEVPEFFLEAKYCDLLNKAFKREKKRRGIPR